MKYLNSKDLETLGIRWPELIRVIEEGTSALRKGDYSQPIKPYLRYKDPVNRIIAMPAYVGGRVEAAGIKWIASFPGNGIKRLPRAHSVLILNNAETGKPDAIFNTALLSAIRTAAVSGAVIDRYLSYAVAPRKELNVGIIGFGQIGQLHLRMISAILGKLLKKVFIYDLNPDMAERIPADIKHKVIWCAGWEEALSRSDIFMTCTVSRERYINIKPPQPSLHLNVSLRDYSPAFLQYVNLMLVDSWEEICRENTDIEVMHREYGLKETDVMTITEFLSGNACIGPESVVMFNPMGMAVYDISVGKYFFDQALRQNAGVDLEE